MKQIKRVALLVVTVMLILGISLTAYASPALPYGSYSTSITNHLIINDSATSEISRCSCLPVDNYLMASLRIEYVEDGQYNWMPSETSYNYRSGTNVESREVSLHAYTIVYAEGWFKARCGNGSVHSFTAHEANY